MPKQIVYAPDELLDKDYREAYKYLVQKMGGMSVAAIAEDWGISRAAIYKKIKSWKEKGIWDRARREILLPQVEEIMQAQYRVLRDFPAILDEVVNIALHARSDQWKLEAAKWLHERIVEPVVASMDDGQRVKELQYTAIRKRFDPTSIPKAKIVGKLAKQSQNGSGEGE
jgi:transposase